MQRIRARDNIQPTVKLYVHAVIVLDILTIFYTGFHSPHCNYKIVFDMYRLCDLIRHVLGHNLNRNTEVLTNCHTISFRMKRRCFIEKGQLHCATILFCKNMQKKVQ